MHYHFKSAICSPLPILSLSRVDRHDCFPPCFSVLCELWSSWCCFKLLRTRSIHLSLGLPRGLFPPTFIVVTCFATFMSSLLITWSYHERRFWATCCDWLDHCIAPELFISDSVFPCFALKKNRSISTRIIISAFKREKAIVFCVFTFHILVDEE